MSKTKKQPEAAQTPTQTTPEVITPQYVADKLLEINGKPVAFSHVNAINVFDDRWRVNIYTQEEGFITKKKIQASYFCIINADKFITYKENPIATKK